ncbi:MAG: hypothetical protein Rubg2KO_05760 [Rubricoccaceae bacterium]
MSIQEIADAIRALPPGEQSKLFAQLDVIRAAQQDRPAVTGRAVPTVGDLAGHLFGSIESGIPDLGSNPEHLKGLGEGSMS